MQHESRQPTKEPSPDAAASKDRRAPLDWLARHKKLCLSIGAGLIALAVGAAVCIPLWEGRTVPIAAEASSAAEPADSTVSPEASRIESIPAESLSASLPQETSAAPANSFVLSSAAKAPGASPPVSSQGPVCPTLPLPDAEPLFAAPEERLTDLTMMEDNTIDSIICYLDGWIYFWESGKGGLVARMRPDGSERETLCGNVGYVCPVEDQGIIYYTPKKYVDEEWTQGDIRTLNLTDRSQTTLPTPTGVNRIWVHDGWILYRCDSTRTNTDGPLYAMRTDGSDLVRLADRCSRVVFNDSWAVIGEPEESGMLFCHTMTCFRFQDKTKQVFQLDGTQPTPCLIQGEELYFTMMYQTDIEFRNHPCYNASLYRLHLGDFTMEKLAEYEGVNSIYGLTAQDGWIYFTREIGPNDDFPGYALYRMRPDGAENTYLCQHGLPQRRRIQGDMLYFTTFDENNNMVLRSMSLDGEHYQTLYRCGENSKILDFLLINGKPNVFLYTWP